KAQKETTSFSPAGAVDRLEQGLKNGAVLPVTAAAVLGDFCPLGSPARRATVTGVRIAAIEVFESRFWSQLHNHLRCLVIVIAAVRRRLIRGAWKANPSRSF